MKAQKRARLTRAGWKVGGADDFLGLSKEEALLVEMKLDLAERLREFRENRKLSQAEVAKLLGSSQSRVAKMEAADGSVTLDLLVRALPDRSSETQQTEGSARSGADSGQFSTSSQWTSAASQAGRRRFDPGRPLSKNPLCRKGFFTFGIGTPRRRTGRAPAAPAQHRCTTIARA
jgi:transcriptional regulator with XRE-family HTH domain